MPLAFCSAVLYVEVSRTMFTELWGKRVKGQKFHTQMTTAQAWRLKRYLPLCENKESTHLPNFFLNEKFDLRNSLNKELKINDCKNEVDIVYTIQWKTMNGKDPLSLINSWCWMCWFHYPWKVEKMVKNMTPNFKRMDNFCVICGFHRIKK